jgi:hypothetical protein
LGFRAKPTATYDDFALKQEVAALEQVAQDKGPLGEVVVPRVVQLVAEQNGVPGYLCSQPDRFAESAPVWVLTQEEGQIVHCGSRQ